MRLHARRVLALDGEGGVAGQPLAPVLIGRPHGLADQQAAEAGAVDEQVARDFASVVQFEGADEAVFRPEFNAGDAGVDALHSGRLCISPQVAREQGGVEVQSPVEHRQGRRRGRRRLDELACARQRSAQRPGGQGRLVAALALFGPVVVKAHPAQVLSVQAEGVDEVRARLAPAGKANAQLAAGLGRRHHLGVGHAELGVEAPDGRDGRLADTDRADLGRLHHGDADAGVAQVLDQGGCRHPAGRASADDHDVADRVGGSLSPDDVSMAVSSPV
jgi:hypothetical protein